MKLLLKYSDERIHGLVELLQQPQASYTAETFHSLRVEIKKIRFLRALLEFADSKYKKRRSFKELDKLFKKAGAVRDPEIILGILKRNLNSMLFQKLKPYLDKEIKAGKAGLYRYVSAIGTNTIKKHFNRGTRHLESISKKEVAGFHKKLLAKYSKISKQKHLANKDIHAVRKLLKLISYCSRIVTKKNKKDLVFLKLSTAIGTWHDYDITTEYVGRALRNKSFSQKNRSAITKALTNLKLQKRAILKNIRTTIRGAH